MKPSSKPFLLFTSGFLDSFNWGFDWDFKFDFDSLSLFCSASNWLISDVVIFEAGSQVSCSLGLEYERIVKIKFYLKYKWTNLTHSL